MDQVSIEDNVDNIRKHVMEHIKYENGVLTILIGMVPGMRVPCKVFVGPTLYDQLIEEMEHFWGKEKKSFIPALYQVANAAALPGIVGASIGLPDIHTGYGFAIGHVAAFDLETGVVSPGGVGYDINCGVRMLRTNLNIEDISTCKEELADTLAESVPVGLQYSNYKGINIKDLREIFTQGMSWAVRKGYAWNADMEFCEEKGIIGVDESLLIPENVGQKAEGRGVAYLGTLGSGNHYLEVQKVVEIYDEKSAAAMGINKIGQICIMIHCGSRGLGHQFAEDSIKAMESEQNEIPLNDPQLACCKINSPKAQLYLALVGAASNYAFVNRSLIANRVREAFEKVLKQKACDMDMNTVYDVSHNIVKKEKHLINGEEKELLVHRKGSTRAFPPHHPELPAAYKEIGQPILVGGSMGTCSFVLTGTEKAMQESMGSTCHGAGRSHGRNVMKRTLDPANVLADLTAKGIILKVPSSGINRIAEEAPQSYKDVTKVVETCEFSGISKLAFKLEPVIVIKG